MTLLSVAHSAGSTQTMQTKSAAQPLTNADSNSQPARRTYGMFSFFFSIFQNKKKDLLAQVAASKQSKSSRTVAQPATETDSNVQGCVFFLKIILF